jgi:hypothetical protein
MIAKAVAPERFDRKVRQVLPIESPLKAWRDITRGYRRISSFD